MSVMTLPSLPRTAASTSAAGGSQTGSSGQPKQVDYMKLIIAQMTNLNPMDPSSNQDGMTMMMQAESLNQLNQLTTDVETLGALTQISYAAGMLGRTITGLNSGGQQVTGVVSGMTVNGTGATLELQDGETVAIQDVTHVGV